MRSSARLHSAEESVQASSAASDEALASSLEACTHDSLGQMQKCQFSMEMSDGDGDLFAENVVCGTVDC